MWYVNTYLQNVNTCAILLTFINLHLYIQLHYVSSRIEITCTDLLILPSQGFTIHSNRVAEWIVNPWLAKMCFILIYRYN